MISPPSNGSTTTIADGEAGSRRQSRRSTGSRPGKRAGHLQADQRGADRAAGDGQIERRQEDGRRSSAERGPEGRETASSWTAASANSALAPTIAASRASLNGLDKPARRARDTIIRIGNSTAKPSASPATQRQNDCISGHPNTAPAGAENSAAASAGAATPPSMNIIA